MLTDSAAQLSFSDLFDSLPDNVVYYRAVRDETDSSDNKPNPVVDFVIDYINPAAIQTTSGHYHITLNSSLRHGNPQNEEFTEHRFIKLREVLESGNPQEVEYFNPKFNRWFLLQFSKAGEGVLSVARQSSTPQHIVQENERQHTLLDSVFNTPLNTIFVYEAVRDETGVIQDFAVRLVNERGRTDVLNRLGIDVVGKTLLQINPNSRQGGQFELFRQIIESGKPYQTEQFYPDAKSWYNTSISKLDDGVVVIGNDITAQKEISQELERVADELQAVIDNAQTGICVIEPVCDPTGRPVDFRLKIINRVMASFVGQMPDALTGKLMSDWFPGYYETGLFDRYKTTLDTGEVQRFDVHYNVDGYDVWSDVQAVKYGDDVLVTFADYTDLKLAQLAQEQQTALLNSVLDGSINGIMSFGSVRNAAGQIQDFRFLTMNEASAQTVGRTVDEITGKSLLSIFPGNVDSGLFTKYIHTTETGESTRTEVYYNHDGLDFWLDVSARKLGDGFVVTFTDISVVKRAWQLVEQSAAELQTVIDTAQTGIFLIDPVSDDTGEVIDFRFRMANKMLAAYAGQDSTAVAGVRASVWFPEYQTNGLFDHYKRTYETGEQQRFDFHYEGNTIDAWLDIMTTKVNDEVLVTFSDFTPLKKLQQQLEASVIDLQRSNKNLEQFAYVASHDLQEPLRKIQQFGDILYTKYASVLDEDGQGMLTRMQSAADRMRVLIRDVLAYSRITTKRDNAKSLDLNTLIAEVLTDLETAVADKQAIVHVSSLPTLPGDAVQIRQLFQNLISNALKFSKPGQQPELHLTSYTQRGQETGLLVSPADDTKLFHRLELSDNGIGFDPSHADKIFQVFQRLHNRSEYAGTGIGLAIVQKVVENHQGYIRAEGRPGAGATFVILLPV